MTPTMARSTFGRVFRESAHARVCGGVSPETRHNAERAMPERAKAAPRITCPRRWRPQLACLVYGAVGLRLDDPRIEEVRLHPRTRARWKDGRRAALLRIVWADGRNRLYPVALPERRRHAGRHRR